MSRGKNIPTPDPFGRTIRLQIKTTDDHFVLDDGNPLPKLKPEILGELILPAYAIANDAERKKYTSEEALLFFPANTELWARVRYENIHDNLKKHRLKWDVWPANVGLFVAFYLKEELYLLVRAGKNAALIDCKCSIPALQSEADSVNHAYTQISTAFEPSRRSHTGNVFQKVYLERSQKLIPLEETRLDRASGV